MDDLKCSAHVMNQRKNINNLYLTQVHLVIKASTGTPKKYVQVLQTMTCTGEKQLLYYIIHPCSNLHRGSLNVIESERRVAHL